MPLTESIMFFYREALPMSYLPYQFAGCVLIWQQWKWRVTVEYKRLVISYTRPLSTIAIIPRRTSLLFSVQSYCSFFLHLPGHRPADSVTTYLMCFLSTYKVFYWWRKF